MDFLPAMATALPFLVLAFVFVPLTPDRQSLLVPDPPITAHILEPLDVQTNLPSQIPLNRMAAGLNRRSDDVGIPLRQFIGIEVGINIGILENLQRHTGAYTVKNPQSNLKGLVSWNINA